MLSLGSWRENLSASFREVVSLHFEVKGMDCKGYVCAAGEPGFVRETEESGFV